MSVLGSTRITVRVCQMYYLEDMSQKEIAAKLGISRPQISRILAAARKEKVVNITINDPYAKETRLQNILREKYPLKDVLVFNAGAAPETRLESFGYMAAQCLDLYIQENSLVGVMSGQTIDSVVKGIGSFSRRGLQVVPLVGGLGALNPNWHANSIAMNLAQKSGGMSYVLNAPTVVRDEQAHEMFLNEPEISGVLELGSKCQTALIGVGNITEESSSIKAGSLSTADVESLQQMGVVASVCCSYIDAKGNIVDVPLARRSIGQTLTSLSKATIILAAIGEQKAKAIGAALATGQIDVLLTDILTAQKLEKLAIK